MKDFRFTAAKPVWIKDRETQMNASLLLRAVLPRESGAVLRIAAHSRYQIFINGAFFADGPARAAHGIYRGASVLLSSALTEEENVVCILITGYNINSFYLLDEPSFVCAEIEENGNIPYATGTAHPFEAIQDEHRLQRVQRYSFQRPFTECYLYDAFYDLFRTDPAFKGTPCVTEPTEEKHFIETDTPACDYAERTAQTVCSRGETVPEEKPEPYRDRSLNGVDGKIIKGFPEAELECGVINELRTKRSRILDASSAPAKPLTLNADSFAVFDMGGNTTGLIRLRLTAGQNAVIYAVFSEILSDAGVPQPGHSGCANAVKWTLQGGRAYDLVSFEPYTYRYIQILSIDAPCTVDSVSQYMVCFPEAALTERIRMDTPQLQAVYDAAVETFRQNATDIFMDCPSRERGGWLCDSFFTARAEYALTGESRVERAFLENFIVAPELTSLPTGMLPMCYPGDHPDGAYIPNWAMWFALELEEYVARSGDRALAEAAKTKLYGLASFLQTYENEEHLLAKLDGWVFVEWSKANDYTQDINYPTNMLYARFLESLTALYKDSHFADKAQKIKEAVRRQSFDGVFFVDNALLSDGKARPTRNRTETAQYYAFFTGVATPEQDPDLYRTLLSDFGPGRKQTGAYPDIAPSNAFIGNYLRLELLFRTGKYRQLTDEIAAFFLPMAMQTGTLWEHMENGASCCHGFASGVLYWLHALKRS